MTLPPLLSDLDPDSQSEPELSRLTLLVATISLDVGLPAHVPIAAFIDDVIDIANEQLAARAPAVEVRFDTADGWTLAPLGREPIDPQRSLDQAGVYDGDLLMLAETKRPVATLLFDDVDETATKNSSALNLWTTGDMEARHWFGVALTAALTLAALVSGWADQRWVPVAALGLGAAAMMFACVLGVRAATSQLSGWVAAVALPLLFAGALYVVPGGFGATSLPMACALSALGSVVVLLVSATGRVLHTAVITAAALAGTAACAWLLWQPPVHTVGAVLTTVSVVVVYLAPRTAILVSRLPIPRVPTAGEPLDDIETQGAPTVEGVDAVGKQVIPTEADMLARVGRASQYLTGILIAAALTAVVGCYLTVDAGSETFRQETIFAILVAAVLCLRGRGHHNAVQSATLIGAGLMIAIAVIVKSAVDLPGQQSVATVALIALMALAGFCGLVAPRLEFSPVLRRQVEILEYLAVGSLFPLLFWIIRLYAFFRELRV